jgi:murein DD-endopeptidase MepM/ murein hydrolase activator NlpD
MRIRNQRLTVILVPQGGAKTYSFQARVDLLAAAGALLALLFLVTLTLMFTYGHYFLASRQTARLEREVERLQGDLAEIEVLKRELAENERTRRKVLGLLASGTSPADSLPALRHGAGATVASAPASEEIRAHAEDFQRSVPRTWPMRGPVTKEFLAGSTDARGFHPGIDIAAATGTPVRAAAAATVTFAGWDPEYGYLVVLEHGLGLETRYGHNSRLSVAAGDRVERGQLIASAGTSGRSTGPHLHFEIRKDGVPVDPRKYLE